MLIAAPMLIVAVVVGVVSCLPQVGWHPTTKTLKPKFSKLNPINGIKRTFSGTAVMNFLKSLLKMTIIGMAIYSVLKDEIEALPGLVNLTLMEAVIYIGNLAVDLGITVGGWFILVAAIDYAYTKYKHESDLKMTKYEIKQEFKESEGDPQIKGKIRHKMQEASMRRMMQSVPEADVIITNPTHFAVAIKYDREGDMAPVVVAKGVDFLAIKIKDTAREHNIEIVENKPLARALYSSVDIGKEIPQELYQAVAEILAFVYRLRNLA
jgi:flagellar biosynthetic protein FlhB